MGADLQMATLSRFDKAANLMVSLPGTFLLRTIGDLLDEVGQQSHIAPLPQQQTIGRRTIAACTTGFLVVLLDRFWQRKVNHGADRSLIDPQSKSDSADQNANLIRHPTFLIAAPRLSVHFAVIGDCGNAPLLEKIHGLLHAIDSGSVNDDVTAGVLAHRTYKQRVLYACLTLLH